MFIWLVVCQYLNILVARCCTVLWSTVVHLNTSHDQFQEIVLPLHISMHIQHFPNYFAEFKGIGRAV